MSEANTLPKPPKRRKRRSLNMSSKRKGADTDYIPAKRSRSTKISRSRERRKNRSLGHEEDCTILPPEREGLSAPSIVIHSPNKPQDSKPSGLRASLSRKANILRTISAGNINLHASNGIDPDEIVRFQSEPATEVTLKEPTVTPNNFFQTPTLTKMYTVQGAYKLGLFSEHFEIQKIELSDSFSRHTATQGTIIDMVEWCSFFPGSNITRYLLLSYRNCFSAEQILGALKDLWKQYTASGRITNSVKERIYAFLVQWILLWGSVDFTISIRNLAINFVDEIFHDYSEGVPLQHIHYLLNSKLVLESIGGEVIENEGPKFSFKALLYRTDTSPKKNSFRVTLPLSMITKDQPTFDLLEHQSSIICEHLTWIESDLFIGIQVSEFMKNNWLRDNKKIVAPYLTNLAEHFNKVSTWVSTQIITASSLRRQVRLFSKFIRIARRLIRHRNYSTASQIVSGLTNISVSRLRELTEGMSSKELSKLEKYQKLLGPEENYKRYRKLSLDKPCIPLLPVHLKDIARIQEIAPNFLDEEKQIVNLDKMHSLGMRVYTLYNMKREWFSYPFNTSLSLRDLLLTSITGGMDQESLYQASLSIQPIKRAHDNRKLRRSNSMNQMDEQDVFPAQYPKTDLVSVTDVLMRSSDSQNS